MAYVYDPNLTDEENKKKEEEQNRLATGGGVLGADSPAGSFPQGNKEGSGTYTNLKQYLDQNREQAADISRKIGDQISTAGKEARTSAEGLVQSAQNQIGANRISQSGIIDEAVTDPTAVASDPEKKAAFSREYNAEYAGPMGLVDVEGYGDVQSKIKAAQERADLSKTEPGRMELLKGLTPGGGQGKLALNQMLLSADPNAYATLEESAAPFSGLQDYLKAQTAAIQDLAQGAKAETEATRTAAGEKTAGLFPELQSSIDARVAETRQEAADRLELQRRAVQAGLLNADLMGGLGTGTPEDVRRGVYYGNLLNSLYGTNYDPMDYFTVTGSPEVGIQPSNVATAEDYAKYAALAELLGQDPGFLSAENQNMAGTAPMDYADVDFYGMRQIPQRLRAEDQAYVDKYGATLDPDGRINISGDITTEGEPEEIVNRIKEIYSRGIGNLTPEGQEAMERYLNPDTQDALDRILNPYIPTPPPPPEQEHGGAPDDSLVETPPEPTPEPLPEPPTEFVNEQGHQFYGWLGDGAETQDPNSALYMNDEGQVVGYDGTVQLEQGWIRDPNTNRLYRPGTEPPELSPEPYIPPPPPPHPSGYEYYGWLQNGTPIFSIPNEQGQQVPVYYDGTPVRAFGIHRDPVTGQVVLIGAV